MSALAKAALVIAGVGLVGLAVYAATRAAPKSTGWTNEEIVDVVRGEEGFIERMVIHRDLSDK